MDFSFMRGRRCRVLGISNGLLCVKFAEEYSHDIIVCNPVTGNFKRIPPFVCEPWFEYFSFYGFNSNENGFELIRVNCRSSSVKVSSFSSCANMWKDVIVKTGKHTISTELIKYLRPLYRNRVPVLKNGVFYWDGYRGDSAHVVILDLFNKEFNVISAPDYIYNEEVVLIEFKEQIVVVNFRHVKLDLWMLNEKDKTWRVFKSIDVFYSIPKGGLVKVLGCTGNGQLVLRNQHDRNSELYLSDIDTDDTNILTYVNVEGVYGMYLFAESLSAVQTAVQTGDFGDEV